MADRQPPRPAPNYSTNGTQFLQRVALIITAGAILLIAGIAFAATAVGLVLFAPLIILTSPIWVPIGITLFLLVAGFLTLCGLALAAVAVGSWLYMYLRGLQPPGSNRVDYARSRIADTAGHVKDYAWEYGGYLQTKVKDAAPGA